jgi:hypothetical protein
MAFKMTPKSPALKATGKFSSPLKQVNITDSKSAGDALTTKKQIAGLDKALGNESAVVKGRTLDPGHRKIVELAKNEGNKKKSYVKEGGTATGNMKDYKISSQERADEYTARGWKKDHTTKVAKKKDSKAIKQESTKPLKIQIESRLDKPVIKAEAKAKSPKARRLANKGAKKTGKAAKKQAQADKASAAGNTRKAARKQKAADRKSRKADKKFRQADGAINPDQY